MKHSIKLLIVTLILISCNSKEKHVQNNIKMYSETWDHIVNDANLDLINGEKEIAHGIRVIHAGGHTKGFQVIEMESGNETAIHLGDLLPTHLHFNPLWIMAYDNYPLESIKQKEDLEQDYLKRDAWFTFYHDPFLRACKFDEKGNVLEKVE